MAYELSERENKMVAALVNGFDSRPGDVKLSYFASKLQGYATGCVHHWFGDKPMRGAHTHTVSKWNARHDALVAAIVAGATAAAA